MTNKTDGSAEFILLLTSVSSEEAAKKVGNILVKEHLAACVSIIKGVESIYRWEEKICHEKEFILMIKSKKSLYSALESKIKTIHPYQLPELVVLPITNGCPSYLEWIDKETSKPQDIS